MDMVCCLERRIRRAVWNVGSDVSFGTLDLTCRLERWIWNGESDVLDLVCI